MSLVGIHETIGLVEIHGSKLTQEEKQFIFQFAFQTDDIELTSLLIEELIEQDKDIEVIMKKFETICDEKPTWVKQVENLLVALEIYRLEEEKAVNRLTELLGAYGITVTEEEIRKMDGKSIEEKVKKELIL